MTESFWDRFLAFHRNSAKRVRGRRRDESPLCDRVELLADDPQENDRLLEEILSGRRTALVTPLADWPQGREIPRAETFRVLLDSQGVERCVLRSAGARMVSFRQMSEELALCEGQDTSLAQWQARTRSRLIARCRQTGMPFSLDMLLVVETFAVAYWEE